MEKSPEVANELTSSTSNKLKKQEDNSEFPSIAANEHVSINLIMGEPRLKMKAARRVEDIFFGKHFLDTEKDCDSYGSISNKVTNGGDEENLSYSEAEDEMKDKIEESEEGQEKHESPTKKYKLTARNKQFTCHVCQKIFNHKGRLNVHLRIHSGEKNFECNICKKSFNLKCTLERHMLIHSGEKPYACDVCQKIFNDRSTLKKHKFIHNELKPFPCNECNKSFVHKNDLLKHKRTHTGVINKPFTCDVCNKAFADKSNLNKHKPVHTGEKPYSCDVCNRSFARSSNRNTHRKIHKKYEQNDTYLT